MEHQWNGKSILNNERVWVLQLTNLSHLLNNNTYMIWYLYHSVIKFYNRKKMKVYKNVITKYDICTVLIILNLSKWNWQHHKPTSLSKPLLRRYANGTVIFHFTWFSKAPWTQFLVKLHLVPGNKKFFAVFICFTTSFSSIENRASSLDP